MNDNSGVQQQVKLIKSQTLNYHSKVLGSVCLKKKNKEMNISLIQHGCIKLIKSDNRYFFLQKIMILVYCCFFSNFPFIITFPLNIKARHYRHFFFFMHLSVLRFWALWLFCHDSGLVFSLSFV